MSPRVTGMSLGVTRSPVTHKQTERPRRWGRGQPAAEKVKRELSSAAWRRPCRDSQKQNSGGGAPPHGRRARTLVVPFGVAVAVSSVHVRVAVCVCMRAHVSVCTRVCGCVCACVHT